MLSLSRTIYDLPTSQFCNWYREGSIDVLPTWASSHAHKVTQCMTHYLSNDTVFLSCTKYIRVILSLQHYSLNICKLKHETTLFSTQKPVSATPNIPQITSLLAKSSLDCNIYLDFFQVYLFTYSKHLYCNQRAPPSLPFHLPYLVHFTTNQETYLTFISTYTHS